MLAKIFMVVILVIVIVFVGWIGLSVYSCFARQDTGQPNMPNQEKASYSVYIKNTGNLILTNDYEMHGAEVGTRIFILHSFWELRGKEFKFVEGDVVLNEAIFGEITIKRR